VLLDRSTETEAIDELLQSARRGASGALVLVGEPGMGKSSLVQYAVDSAERMTVASITGFESEMGLSFAALHQLVAPMLDRKDGLPAPQARALGAAFGLIEGEPPDRLLVGLAVLTLLADAAAERPFLCTFDDADYFDQASEQVLAFVARRLEAEGIALLISLAEPSERPSLFQGLPQTRLQRLSEASSEALLDRVVSGALEANVRRRILHAAAGNPLAILELPGGLTPEQLAGTVALPVELPPPELIARIFARRAGALPQDAQMLLLLLAAEPIAEEVVFWRAADELGIGHSALDAAETAGFVIRGPVRLRHALARAAIYAAASAADRRRAHGALASVTDLAAYRDRRAWHRASASAGPDEGVAAELEDSAQAALSHGGYSAVGALLARSAQLSPDASDRADRTLAAARAQVAAGSGGLALTLLDDLEVTNDRQRAEASGLRGSIMFDRALMDQTPEVLLAAARDLVPLDLRLARDAHLEALASSLFAARLGRAGAVLEGAEAALALPAVSEETTADALLQGLALLATEGHAAAAPSFRRAIAMARSRDDLRSFMFVSNAAADLWDDEALRTVVTRWVRVARDAGAMVSLARALLFLGSMVEAMAGRFDSADDAIGRARDLFRSIEGGSTSGRANAAFLFVASWRGREGEARMLAEDAMRDAVARGTGAQVGFAHYAVSVLEVGLGRYEAAFDAAQQAVAESTHHVATWVLPELVEAAVRTERYDVAQDAVGRLEESTQAGGTDWGLGTLARSRALVSRDESAEPLYLEAIERLERALVTPQLARARLVYGEWLRRERRRRDAREHLRSAQQMFRSMGAGAFAERAETELRATGERRRMRTPVAHAILTPHELRIARLVAAGETNADIATQLYVSRRTVEYHLHKIFRKLGLTSRSQLASTLDHGDF
jgi:DNA-binding CsgD family transcriptional regulator